MPIKVTCECGKSFGVPEKYIGKKGKCPACGAVVLVEDTSPPESHVDAVSKPQKAPTSQKTKPTTKKGKGAPAKKSAGRGADGKSRSRSSGRGKKKGSSGLVMTMVALGGLVLLAGGGYFAYQQLGDQRNPTTSGEAGLVQDEGRSQGQEAPANDSAKNEVSESFSSLGMVSATGGGSPLPPSAQLASTAPTGGMPVASVGEDEAYDRIQERIKELGLDTNKSLFFPEPKVGKKWNVKNLGPVGLGIDIVKPGFTMKIQNVEKGSPAEKTGKFKNGQIIKRINDKTLEGRDPRYILGDIVTEAEATDGKISFEMDGGDNVVVEIPVMGRYSKSWPINCEKSDKIVRNLADLIAKQEKPRWGSVIFLLSTGDDKDLEVVKKWMKNMTTIGGYPWDKGYKGPGLCEYYLRTGDESVLPVIKKMADELILTEYNGGWSGRGRASFSYMVGGQLHAAGVHCVTFLLMARMCGVEVDEGMMQRSLKAFYRFAGKGNVAYGNQLPEGGFRDNGKSGGLAVAMAAAARLVPEGESSNYAKARDVSALKSFYGTNWFHSAHTGGGIGEIWHNAAMGLMREKRPIHYRSYMDTRRWVMDLSRRHDGGIGIGGLTDSYDQSASEHERSWGTYFALSYTIPRKHLQIYGAPKTEWCKTYSLPVRPWGTPADDWFLLPTPVGGDGVISVDELMEEIVHYDSSAPLNGRWKSGDLDLLKKYLGHPEFAFRSGTMNALVSKGHAASLVPLLLKSKDPRYRYNGILAFTGMFKGRALSQEDLTPEMFDLVGEIIENPNESWWVLHGAINALARGGKERVIQHKERLLALLKLDAWWVQLSAVKTLSMIAFEESQYKEILPSFIKAYAGFTTNMAQTAAMKGLGEGISTASPTVKDYAYQLLKAAFVKTPGELSFPGGYTVPNGGTITRSRMLELMRHHSEGGDYAKSLPKKTLASIKSGDEKDMFQYPGTFKGNPRFVGTWHWAIWPRPSSEAGLPGAAKSWASKKKREKPKSILSLKDGGIVGQGKNRNSKTLFWHENYLIDLATGIAKKMEIQEFGGKDFLILEAGGFDGEENVEYKKQYTFLMKVK